MSKSIIETIKLRSSKRDFMRKPVDEKLKVKIKEILENVNDTPFKCRMAFKFVEESDVQGVEKKGTYGMIKGAGAFIVGKVKKSEYDLEDFGYAFENIILLVTGMELGTCWLGAAFDRSLFRESIMTDDDEIIPAITPVGYCRERPTLRETLIRMLAKAKERKRYEELFFCNDFGNPLTKDESGKYDLALEMVRLAPSATNKQPWRIVMKDGVFHFFIERSPSYQSLLKKIGVMDLQRIDMGIAMCHFELTAKSMGLEGEWNICKNIEKNAGGNTEYLVSWYPV